MSKPLTIEELKALPAESWVWVEDNTRSGGAYVKVHKLTFDEEIDLVVTRGIVVIDYKYSDYGTTWLAYKNKEQAMGISNYISECVALTCALRDKENLERTIKEINEVLEANGIKFDCNGDVSDDRVEQVKKQTAKEILQEFANIMNAKCDDINSDELHYLAKKYGVEVDE